MGSLRFYRDGATHLIDIIDSRAGVNQGDPLGSASVLFALAAIHDRLITMAESHDIHSSRTPIT